MATSLLRLGRLEHLKVLQREGWGFFKSSAAPFCTKAQEPIKAVKKAKAATLEVSEERATLLAYKTAVGFPVKLLTSGISSAQALVHVEPEASPVTAETIVTAKDVDPAPITASNADVVTAETGVAVEIVSPVLDIAVPKVEAAESASTVAGVVARETIPTEAFAAKAPSVAGAVTPPAPVTDLAEAIIEPATPVVDSAPPVAELDVAASVTEGIPATAGPPEKSLSASADPGDQSADSSSSSSSDSDSESDSDSDDEKSEVESKATPEAVRPKMVSLSSEAESVEVATSPPESTRKAPAEAVHEVTPWTPFASLDTISNVMKEEDALEVRAQDVQASAPEIAGAELVDPAPVLVPGLAGAVASSEELRDSAPEVIVTPVEVVPEADVEDAPGAPVAAVDVATVEVASGAHVDATEEPPESEAAAAPVEAAPVEAAPVEAAPVEAAPVEAAPVEAAPVEAAPVEAAPVEAAPVEAAPVEAAPEELLDTAPVMAEAAGEEMITQPPAEAESLEASEETAAEPPGPAPEPFDNTTYKNLQHHSYNHYTFADLDLEMAKYRLPQPSSGRPSPRH